MGLRVCAPYPAGEDGVRLHVEANLSDNQGHHVEKTQNDVSGVERNERRVQCEFEVETVVNAVKNATQRNALGNATHDVT